MIDANTAWDVSKEIASAAPAAIRFAGWAYRRWYRTGDLQITHPQNRDNVAPGWVAIEGKRSGGKARRFWLLTTRGDEYWIHEPIQFHGDGRWNGRVNVGDTNLPKESVVLLVHVSDLVHQLFSIIKERANKAGDFSPLKLATVDEGMRTVGSITLQVRQPDPKTR